MHWTTWLFLPLWQWPPPLPWPRNNNQQISIICKRLSGKTICKICQKRLQIVSWDPINSWPHSDHILTTFWLHSDYILTTFWLHFNYILTTFWLYSDYIWLHSDHILTTFWLRSDYILTIFRLHSDYILTTFWLHSDYILTFSDKKRQRYKKN